MTFTDFVISQDIVKSPKTKAGAKSAAPFIEWVGGKRSLLEKYNPFIPKDFDNYYEPFVGGGAMFYHIHSMYENSIYSMYGNNKKYFLSDLNQELVITYQTVADNYQEIAKLLQCMNVRHCKEFYYAVRNYDRKKIAPYRYEKLFNVVEVLTPVEIASRFMFLNATCFNALYRVNGDNLFNVPIGTSLKKDIADNGILRLCHDALQDVEIKYQSYQNINPKRGDLVFFDPPYAPISATSSFTSYTSEEFGVVQQIQLKEFCDSLNERGVKFMLANSNCEFIRELYQSYNQYTFALDRRINCKGDLRKQIEDNEILVTNFTA